MEAVDIVRHILPDCVVFLTALANLATSCFIVACIRKMDRISGVVLQEEGQSVQDIESEGTLYILLSGTCTPCTTVYIQMNIGFPQPYATYLAYS